MSQKLGQGGTVGCGKAVAWESAQICSHLAPRQVSSSPLIGRSSAEMTRRLGRSTI